MENEYMKRGFLLPAGCKDLIDVWKFKPQPRSGRPTIPILALPPPITGVITIPAQMTVIELAAALAQEPLQFMFDLMDLGVFELPRHQLDFDTIARVARKYGYTVKKRV
jgi:hypothetical protein